MLEGWRWNSSGVYYRYVKFCSRLDPVHESNWIRTSCGLTAEPAGSPDINCWSVLQLCTSPTAEPLILWRVFMEFLEEKSTLDVPFIHLENGRSSAGKTVKKKTFSLKHVKHQMEMDDTGLNLIGTIDQLLWASQRWPSPTQDGTDVDYGHFHPDIHTRTLNWLLLKVSLKAATDVNDPVWLNPVTNDWVNSSSPHSFNSTFHSWLNWAAPSMKLGLMWSDYYDGVRN